MRGAAQRPQRRARIALVARLAVDRPVQHDEGVAAQHQLSLRTELLRHVCLAQCILERHLSGVTLTQLLHVGGTHRKRNPQTLEDRPALRRAGGRPFSGRSFSMGSP